jgi:hypothetical protein
MVRAYGSDASSDDGASKRQTTRDKQGEPAEQRSK